MAASDSPASASTCRVSAPSAGAGRPGSAGVPEKRAAGRAWRSRPAAGWAASTTVPLARTCGSDSSRVRVSTGAQDTPWAASRASHSSAPRARSASCVRARRSSMCLCRSAGVAKRGSASHSGRPSARASASHSLSLCTATLMWPVAVS